MKADLHSWEFLGIHFTRVVQMLYRQPRGDSWELKADLGGRISAYEYHVRLACVLTSRQIMSCKLDSQHSYDTVDVLSENCAREDGWKSGHMLVVHDRHKQKS